MRKEIYKRRGGEGSRKYRERRKGGEENLHGEWR